MFIALKGEKFNGESFIKEVTNLGAIPLSTQKLDGGITVSDTNIALLKLAAYYKTKLKKLIKTVAITGSVGKTTTKEFLKSILSSAYNVHATPDNLNNEIGMPLTVLSALPDTEILILEMGMNHSGEIGRMSETVLPDIAIITKIGTAHIGNLGSREKIADAKLEIKKGLINGKLIIPFGESLIPYSHSNITFSASTKEADYYINNTDHNTFSIYSYGKLFFKQNLFFTDKHLYECLAAAITCASEIGISKDNIVRGISTLSRNNIRQKYIHKENITFLSDCYNASYESIIAAIDSLKSINGYSVKSLVLGDVLELGDLSEQIHRNIGHYISPLCFSSLYLVGNQVKYVFEGAILAGFPKERIHLNPNPEKLEITVTQIKSHASFGEILLLKASRKIRLERILDYFD